METYTLKSATGTEVLVVCRILGQNLYAPTLGNEWKNEHEVREKQKHTTIVLIYLSPINCFNFLRMRNKTN